MTGEDILKSGCRLLRVGVDEVLVVVPQFIKDLLGAQGYRTVHRLEGRELSDARGSAVPCLPQSSRRRSHWCDCDRRVCITRRRAHWRGRDPKVSTSSTWHPFSANGRRRHQGLPWWVLLTGPRVLGGPCGGSVCRTGSVTSGPSCVDGPTHVETTKSSILCKRTQSQLGIKLLERYLQEPESPHRFDLHWRNCFDCPKESRPPIRARSSSLKYPVLSWNMTAAAHHTEKKIPWSLHQQIVYRRCHQPGGKKRTMQGSQFLTCGGSGPTGGDSKR